MAADYDTAAPVTAVGTTTDLDASYTPNLTLKGVFAFAAQSITTTDLVSMTLNPAGANLTIPRIRSDADITGEFGRTYLHFLGTGIPTGGLTIRATKSGGDTTTALALLVLGLIGDRDLELVDNKGLIGDPNIADPSVLLVKGARHCVVLGGMWNGVNDPANIADGTGLTRLGSHDFTSDSAVASRQTTADTVDFTFQYIVVTNSFALSAAAFAEVPPPASGFALKSNIYL